MDNQIKRIVLIGAGGHAKVVIDALRSAGLTPALCLDPNRKLWGRQVEGVKIEGGDELLSGYPADKTALAIGVGMPRLGSGRRELFEGLRARGYDFPAVRAASSAVSPSAILREGVQVLTRAVVHPGAEIGEGAIVNTSAVVEHDVVIGAHAHVAPAALVLGGAAVGENAFVGAGAIVLPGVRIGAGALVAAGVVVRRDVPENGRALPA